MKRALSFVLALVLLIGLMPMQAFAASPEYTHAVPESQGVANAIARAYQLTDVEWTPLADMPGVNKINGEYTVITYKAGETYKGIPYSGVIATDTYLGLNVSLESFLTALENTNSVLYTENLHSTNPKSATYFGTVCSKFAQYVLDIPGSYNTNNVANIPGVDTIAMPGKYTVDDIKLGDIVLHTQDHTAVCTDILYDADGNVAFVEISEAVFPQVRRKLWSPEDFYAHFSGYRLCRYQYISGVPAAPAETPADREYALMPRFGDKYNYKVSSTKGVVDILESGYSKAVILRDGAVISKIALNGASTFSFDRSIPGDLEMYLEKEDGTRSASVYACVVKSSVAVTDASRFLAGNLSVSFDGSSGTPLYVQVGSGQSIFCSVENNQTGEADITFRPSLVSGETVNIRVAYQNEYGIYLSSWSRFTVDYGNGTGPNPSADPMLSQGAYWDGYVITPSNHLPSIQEGKENYWTYTMIPVEENTTYSSWGANRMWYLDANGDPISTINIYKECSPACQFTIPEGVAYINVSYSPILVDQGKETMTVVTSVPGDEEEKEEEEEETYTNPSADPLLSQGQYWPNHRMRPSSYIPEVDNAEGYWVYTMVPVENGTCYYSNGANRLWFFDANKRPISTYNAYKDSSVPCTFVTPEKCAFVSIQYSSVLVEKGTETLTKRHTYQNGICTCCGEAQPDPVITQQPESVQQEVGRKFAITVKAEGEGLTYQWYIRRPGCDQWESLEVLGNVYAAVMTGELDGCQVYCVVSDKNGHWAATDTAKLTCLMHEHEYTVVVIAPTCTEQGYTTHTCACGESFVDSYVNPTGHQYGAWRVTVVATCTEAGTERRDCEVCDYYETHPVAAKGHDYKSIVTAPSCTEAGYTTYTCACGDSYVDSFVDAIGEHAWGGWMEVKVPTCAEEGRDRRICKECGLEQLRDTRITGDPNKILVSNPVAEDYFTGKRLLLIGDSITYGVGVNDRTTEVYGQIVGRELGMTVSNRGVSGSGYCSGGAMATNKTLTEANVRNADVITIMLGVNDWNWAVKDGSWNGKSGYYDASQTYYQLGDFDSADTSTLYGALHAWCKNIQNLQNTPGFEEKQFVVLTPLITSWNISIGQKNWNQDKQNIHGHVFREYCTAIMEVCARYGIPVLDANTFSGIYYKGAEDNNVAETGGDGVHVNAAGHALLAQALEEFLLEGYSYETRAVKDGGHTYENGVCRDCRLPYICDHAYADQVTEPTCTQNGYTTHTCITCGESFVDSYVNANGHSYGAWIVMAAPTCTEVGMERRDCDVCDHYETRQVAAKGHDYQSIVTVPTSTEKGYTTHTCACGEQYTDNCTDELGHFNATAETLADGEKLVLTELNVIKHNKSLIFSATVNDLGDGLIRISHGQNAYGGNHLEITADKILVYTTNSDTSVKEYSHGLDISGDVSVRLDIPRSKVTITITTASGTYRKTVAWSGCNGDISCGAEGTTLQNVDLRWFATGIGSDYWFFGDSWFNTTSSARWTSYLLDDGYTDVLLAAYPGMRAPAGLTQFRELLTLDTPKYAIWALGMNNGDRNGTVNESWLTSTEEFLRLCAQYGVTPILCTIPTTPKVNNRLKNAWIRESGYRYIDFDLAVVEDHVTGTWFAGMAASDLNHPSELGAKTLYPQVFADFPELAKADPGECSHSMHLLEKRNGACEYGGREAYYVCSLCGGQYLDAEGLVRTTTDQMLTVPPGHAWGDWTAVQEPTSTQVGIQERTCTACGKTDQEELPMLEILYGDSNGDGRVNGLDLVVLRQYLAGWSVTIDPTVTDVTDDGKCNALDLIRLRQYLADWDVTLGP